MIDNSKFLFALRLVTPIANFVFKVLLLGALVWIGYGLQDIANVLYSGGATCAADPASGASDNRDENVEPGLIKPLFRG